MTDPTFALLNGASRDFFTGARQPPLDGIGISYKEGSIVEWDGDQTSRRVNVWRNPPVRDEPRRWTTVEEWQRRMAADPNSLEQLRLDLMLARRPIRIPLGSTWSGAGGQQPTSSDNGIRITTSDSTAWELQGFAPLSPTDVAQIELSQWWALWNPSNASRLGMVRPKLGDWRADLVFYNAPATQGKAKGAQGPWFKDDPKASLLRPADLMGEWSGPKRLSIYNPQFGPGATAAMGAWVEHTRLSQRSVLFPPGDSDYSVPCGTRFVLDITGAGIAEWMRDYGLSRSTPYGEASYWYARGWADHGVRTTTTGEVNPYVESVGAVNPRDRDGFILAGVNSESKAKGLGRGVFNYGVLTAA